MEPTAVISPHAATSVTDAITSLNQLYETLTETAAGGTVSRDHKRPHTANEDSWQAYSLPFESGCDSSDCALCQGLARLRQLGGASPFSQASLPRKRSRDDLLAEAAAAGSSSSLNAVPRVPSSLSLSASSSSQASAVCPLHRLHSIWDHALLEADAGEQLLAEQQQQLEEQSLQPCACGIGGCPGCEAGGWQAWRWNDGWEALARPVRASMQQVAAFMPPTGQRSRKCCSADIVCSLEFEPHGWLLATAGVTKQVRVYSLASALQCPEEPHWQRPLRVHRMASKLSSLAWNPHQPGVATVGDYDGAVTQLDLEYGHLVSECDEHSCRRVWSVSHSPLRHNFCASASDDGTVRLWSGPCPQRSCGVLRPPGPAAPLCSVHLSPHDANLLAVASADSRAYVYDLRMAGRPLLTLEGHSRAVSYVRWMSPARLITASVDASLAVWDLDTPEAQAANMASSSEAAADGSGSHLRRHCRGHLNTKNFVGLAVRPEDQLIACGSEEEACFCYTPYWDMPVVQQPLPQLSAAAPQPGTPSRGRAVSTFTAGHDEESCEGCGGTRFCCAVAWQPAAAMPLGPPLLAAAMSDGELRVLALRRQCLT